MRPGAAGTALITGASSGIGAAFAHRLAATGHDLILVARRSEQLGSLAAELRASYAIEAEVLVADLSDHAALLSVEERIQQLDSLQMLVHAAGFGTAGNFARNDVDRQVEMIQVHDVAAVRLTRAALPGMIARRSGAIIHVSSIAAFLAGPGNVTYSATKAFLNAFCEGLQAELAGTGVRIQSLCPGLTRTEFHDTVEFQGLNRPMVPRLLWMSADDVAAQSLRALQSGQVIFIPGFKNRLLVAVAQLSPIRALWRRLAPRLRRQRLR